VEWPPEFHAQLDGSACPFPEQDPPPMPDERLRADVEALQRATR